MLILASASPRRQELLEEAGIPFRVVVPDVIEDEPARGDPHAVATANARRKAEGVSGEVVLAADTVVAVGERLLGKPADEAEAARLLRALSGTTHRVVTGVALKVRGQILVRSVESRVTMRPLTEEEIATSARSGEGLGKAGGYAIQETADRFVVRLQGSYDNVVGLPVDTVTALLREAGIDLDA
jgi:septum formation protein